MIPGAPGSVISAITLSPQRRRLGLYFDVHDHNINTHAFEVFFAGCGIRFVAGSSWSWIAGRSTDRAPGGWWSASEASFASNGFGAYAPDLNPVEQVWSHTKYADLANTIPDDVEALAYEVMDSLEQASTRQQLLRSFFDHAELKL